MSANANQPTRFQVATIGYNSYHWQQGGLVIIELFNQSFAAGYEKYVLENGFGQGANTGVPVLKLVESYGIQHSAKITMGTTYDLTTTFGGYVNRALPVYLDLRNYATYRIRVTYLQDRVDQLTSFNQIVINTYSSGTEISEFNVSTILDLNLTSNGILTVKGSGIHSFENGSLGIGTLNTQGYKLAVAGSMIAESVKVKLQSAWPDYVFNKTYIPRTLQSTEKYILKYGHLPGLPSAEEVHTEGIDLAKINIKLLEKIEELTLHLIAKDKSEIRQQQELTKLRNDFERLKKRNKLK
ncbi:MAG: hypothetical protein H7069_06790 [Phormidesmis sp. FL-bin-119]|nr:hypothetical protein [Pedobacter sp.]